VGSRAWALPSLFTSIFVNTKCSPWGHKDSLTSPLPLQTHTHTHTHTKTHASHASHFRLPSCMMNGCAKPNRLLLENVAWLHVKKWHTILLWLCGTKAYPGQVFTFLSFFFFFFLFFNYYSKLAKFFFCWKNTLCTEKTCFFQFLFTVTSHPQAGYVVHITAQNGIALAIHNLWYEICSRTLGLWILVMGTFHYQG